MTRFEKFYQDYLSWNPKFHDCEEHRAYARNCFDYSKKDAKQTYSDMRCAAFYGLMKAHLLDGSEDWHTRAITLCEDNTHKICFFIGNEPAFIVSIGEEIYSWTAWTIEQLGEKKADGTYDCVAKYEIDWDENGKSYYKLVK